MPLYKRVATWSLGVLASLSTGYAIYHVVPVKPGASPRFISAITSPEAIEAACLVGCSTIPENQYEETETILVPLYHLCISDPHQVATILTQPRPLAWYGLLWYSIDNLLRYIPKEQWESQYRDRVCSAIAGCAKGIGLDLQGGTI